MRHASKVQGGLSLVSTGNRVMVPLLQQLSLSRFMVYG